MAVWDSCGDPVAQAIEAFSRKGETALKVRRLQLCKLLLTALLAGVGCTAFMVSSLMGQLMEYGVEPMDLY